VDLESHPSTELLELGAESNDRVPANGEQATAGGAVERIQLLWDERRRLARCTGVGLIVFTLIALLIPPKYQSITRLMPPEESAGGLGILTALAGGVTSSSSADSGSSGSESPIGEITSNLLAGKSQGALFIGVLRSRTVEDAIIRRFDLRKLYGIRRWVDTRKKLEERTEIAEDRKSKIIEIRVLDRSPQRAQALARAYVEELNRAVSSLSTSSARREREFLEGRLVGVKQDLDQASQEFSRFASQNTAIDVPEQGKAMVQAAAVLQGELIAAEAEEQGLKQIYTENNVRVRSLEGRIEELRRKLRDVGEAGTGMDGNGSDASSNSGTALYPSIRKLPLLGVTYFDLYRRVKIQEAVFEALTKRYEIAKVEEAKEIPTVRELDPADLPEKKASPKRTQIVISGFIFSLVAGCCWILGIDKWRRIDAGDRRKVLILRIATDVKRGWFQLRAQVYRLTSKKTPSSDFRVGIHGTSHAKSIVPKTQDRF